MCYSGINLTSAVELADSYYSTTTYWDDDNMGTDMSWLTDNVSKTE
jgi:hypothetical protein